MHPDPSFDIRTESELSALFQPPQQASIAKELDHVDRNYAAWIAASRFFVLCTAGPRGLDASPRGDPKGFVRVQDTRTLLWPERRGNNRIDSLRNLISDPRLALLFLIPGVGETLRVNGRARLSADPALRESFTHAGKVPVIVVVMSVEAVFFQCSRAIVRSDLWNPAEHVERSSLATPGRILGDATHGAIDGEAYDRELPNRIATTLY